MEVEDRHLNVMIDLINDVVNSCPPLLYLSDEFCPSDVVYRLSQMILMYENHVLSDSEIRPSLELSPNSDTYCLTVCSAIKVWLLSYYKYDFVTLNGIKLENGVEEEIVLTSLMVLRVLYRMRQLMDNRVNQILTNGWKDLQEFDQQLDEKFETKCLYFMDLLVKHSKSYKTKFDSFVQQIHDLDEENEKLIEKLKTNEENCGSNHLYFNRLALKRITRVDDRNESSEKPTQRVSPRKTTPSDKSVYRSSTKSKTKSSSTLQKLLNKRKESKGKTTTTDVLSVPMNKKMSKIRSKAKSLSPQQNEQKTTSNTRRSPRISNSSSKPNENSKKNTFCEIRAIFSESDDSEFEYFDQKQSTKSLSESIDLSTITSLKKRKSKPKTKTQKKLKTNLSTDNKTVKSGKTQSKTGNKLWPSRSKNYPRKKRYPCDDCDYIADRPSTLVRHRRAHTGEKPFCCDWPGCYKRYKMSSNLTPHRLTHTGTKPYVCDWPHCIKKFTYPQHLKRHRIGHQKKARLQRTIEVPEVTKKE